MDNSPNDANETANNNNDDFYRVTQNRTASRGRSSLEVFEPIVNSPHQEILQIKNIQKA